jgi:acetyl/propionyl-CoA carboxylase alpha subunit/acetyl-CoA carboxylase carboxyltransferase component
VRLADEAIDLGTAQRATETGLVSAYCDHDHVMETIRAAKCDAVWPGWGFASEDAAFVARCEKEGVVFIGPPSASMIALGDKIGAKEHAEHAEIPLAAWRILPVEPADADLREWGKAIGFPLMVKASAGGGGRGIRRVESPDELAAAVESAGGEAQRAFGDGRLFMERCVTGARHVEVQFVVDRDGTASAIGVRDCSLQRRNQKIIEETPSPVLPKDVSERLLRGTERLVSAVGYRGVGTAEFLYRPTDGLVTFLEVNSRLQVEHTITEMVTGSDLVRAQLLIAQELEWEPPRGHSGWAIQARVNAEDCEDGFRPAPGKIRVFRVPTGPGIRVDSGVVEGADIAPEFDSMIAKVIAWGATRQQAAARLSRALAEFDVVVENGATNKAFLSALLRSPAFVDGAADTSWLDRHAMEVAAVDADGEAAALVAAAIVSYRRAVAHDVTTFATQCQNGIPQNLPEPIGHLFNMALRGRSAALHVYGVAAGQYEVETPGGVYRCGFEDLGPHTAQLTMTGQRRRVLYADSPIGLSVEVDGTLHVVELASGGEVVAPAPAMVVDVFVVEGDVVEPGTQLCMLEAMKMELPVVAREGGTVRRVRCRAAEQVMAGQTLVEIETSEAGETPQSDRPLEFPAAAQRVVEVLFSAATPTPELLDDAPREFVDVVLSEIAGIVRGVMLGYDVSNDVAKRIEMLFGAKLEFPGLQRTEIWAPLVDLLRVFVDTTALFGRALVDVDEQGGEVSAHLAFYEYCRLHHLGEDAVPSLIRDDLERALAHFGVRSFDPTPELQAALWRLGVANAHSDLRHRLCSSLLRLLNGLFVLGTPIHEVDALEATLNRILMVASSQHPYVLDNAAQALYVLFRQSKYVSRTQERTQTAELLAIDASDAASAASQFDSLARSSQTVLPFLLGSFEAASPLASHYLAAILRRVYARDEVAGDHSVEDGVVRASTLSEGVALMSDTATPALWRGISAALDAGIRSVDVLTHGAPPATAPSSFPAEVHDGTRVSWLWNDGEMAKVRTWAMDGGDWKERWVELDVHPATAARMELDRLAEFQLERLPSPERILAFRAKARSNPKDERVFVRAEVFGDSRDDSEPWPRWEFEKVYYEGLRVIREAQSVRGRRDRLYRNRLTVYLRTEVPLDGRGVSQIADGLETPTRRLGLESVNVRTTVVDPATLEGRRVEFVISKPGRHRLDVRTREPVTAPILPLSEYEQRVVRARRMGFVYPYEVIGMLEGHGSDAGEGVFQAGAGNFIEYDFVEGEFVAVDRARGLNTAGVIAGVIENPTDEHPDGIRRVLIASDPTRSLGSLAEPECVRVIAALDLAESLDVPVEWLAVSSGARISMESGTENLDWTAAVLRRIVLFTQAGREIHVVVCGVNVGAQSYWNAEATMLMHTKGVLIMTHDGSMVLTGKRALEYSGSVSAEDEKGIGGADRIMGPNGQAQFVARDLGDAYRILFDYYRFAYRSSGQPLIRQVATSDPIDRNVLTSPYAGSEVEFQTIGDLFSEVTNPGRKKPFSIRHVMDAVRDVDAPRLERWRAMRPAEMVVVWDTRVGGVAVSLLGVESKPLPRFGRVPADGPDRWTGGTLFPKSSKKMARALNAASGNRPVVILANLSGFDGSPESLRKWQLEFGAEIGRAVVNFDGPILFVVVGRYHGGAYVVFSKSLNPSLQSLALEGSFASVIGGGPAAAVVFPREVRKRAAMDERVVSLRNSLSKAPREIQPRLREELNELIAEATLNEQQILAAEFDQIHTVERAVEVGSLDAVIPAERLRPEIVERLLACRSSDD